MTENKMSFEQAALQLEKIVKQMESKDISLEESMSLYEQSFELLNYCYKQLESGRGKIEDINSRIQTIKNSEGIL